MQLNACINIYGIAWIDHRYRSLAPARRPTTDDCLPTNDDDTTADPIDVSSVVCNYLINRVEFFATCLLLITWASSNRAVQCDLSSNILHSHSSGSAFGTFHDTLGSYINYNIHWTGNILIIFHIIVGRDRDTWVEQKSLIIMLRFLFDSLWGWWQL